MPDREISNEVTQRFLLAMRYIISNRINGVSNQTEFGEVVHEYQQNFSKMERGTRYPTIENMGLLCRDFGINPNWLILGLGSMMRKDKESEQVIKTLKRIEKSIENLPIRKKPAKSI